VTVTGPGDTVVVEVRYPPAPPPPGPGPSDAAPPPPTTTYSTDNGDPEVLLKSPELVKV
jgi:hypothetical protein